MPTPTRQITGTFKDSDLQPAAGKKIRFIPLAYRTDTTNKVRLFEQSIEVTLDSSGQIPTSPQFTLVCTDATGVVPTLVGYQVTELFGNGPKHPYFIDVPTGVGALDMADIAPLANPPVPPEIFASIQVMEAGDAATLEAAEEYTNTHSGGGSFPASTVGWLHDDGTGTRAWSTPTAAQVGADTAAARDTAISTATAPLATSLTNEASVRAAADLLALLLDGTRPMAGDLALGGHKVTGAADATTATGLTTLQQATALVNAAIAGLEGGDAVDTIAALRALINSDESTLTSLLASVAAAMTKAANGADIVSPSAFRTNLGLGTSATHDATEFQAADADLTAIAALTTTAFGRAFLAMADAAATKTALSLVKADVGLGSVDNTSDVNKPVSTAQAAALAAWPPIQSTAPDPATTHLWIDTTVDPTAYQPLDTDLTAIAALTPADGQLLQWSNALGAWTVVNPTGSSLLAYSENNTGTAQASLTSGTTDVTSCSIAVPASTRPVLLFASIAVLASVAPTNAAPTVQITEVSNGTDTPITIDANGGMVTVINRTETLIVPLTQLATSTARTRTFKLQFVVPGTGTWSVLNGSGYRSVIGAMAG